MLLSSRFIRFKTFFSYQIGFNVNHFSCFIPFHLHCSTQKRLNSNITLSEKYFRVTILTRCGGEIGYQQMFASVFLKHTEKINRGTKIVLYNNNSNRHCPIPQRIQRNAESHLIFRI